MKTLALDIGGANIKYAHSDGQAGSMVFALWKQPDQLACMLGQLAKPLPAFDRLALTMTGELCDCFATKREGVDRILTAAEAFAGTRGIGVWSTEGRFIHPDHARQRPLRCAAGNWHALACFAADMHPDQTHLLIDTGSTTSDILLLDHGRALARGWTDPQRLVTGELVYIGARRTPLMALGPAVELEGYRYGVMAEWFADTADLFVLLGDLPEEPACTQTADHRPLDVDHCGARVARMIGADLEILSPESVRNLAQAFADNAIARIAEGINQVIAEQKIDGVMLSGSGSFLARRAARSALPQVPMESLADRIGVEGAAAACAMALLHLLEQP